MCHDPYLIEHVEGVKTNIIVVTYQLHYFQPLSLVRIVFLELVIHCVMNYH